jgi:cell division protein FtsZ
MKNAGNAIMGAGSASGEGRAQKAVTLALESPLLNDNDITGARQVLLNITVGSDEILMDEIMEITDYIQDAAGQSAEVIWGYAIDEELAEDVCVTVIATGFEAHEISTDAEPAAPQKIIHPLGDETKEVTQTIEKAITLTPTDENEIEESEEPFLVTQEAEASDIQETQEADLFSESEEKVIHNLDDEPLQKTENDTFNVEVDNDLEANAQAENKQKSREAFLERQSQVKRTLNDVKMKLRLPGRISDLENEPAYKRRNVSLDDVSHSSESNVSHFSINEEVDEHGERKIELRDDNPFLHDNVD